MSDLDSLEFRVELWDERDLHVLELVAAANNALVAKAAYDEALRQRPRANLMLRHRARVVARARG